MICITINHSVLKVARMGNFKLESSVLAESNALGNNHSFFFFFFFLRQKQSTKRKTDCLSWSGGPYQFLHSLL